MPGRRLSEPGRVRTIHLYWLSKAKPPLESGLLRLVYGLKDYAANVALFLLDGARFVIGKRGTLVQTQIFIDKGFG